MLFFYIKLYQHVPHSIVTHQEQKELAEKNRKSIQYQKYSINLHHMNCQKSEAIFVSFGRIMFIP